MANYIRVGAMALPLQALLAVILFVNVEAHGQHPLPSLKHHRPKFQPGPWKSARATFYEGNEKTFGGACGYSDTGAQGYGHMTAALSNALFNEGQTCGACYEIKCVNCPQWCKPGQPSIVITATDNCPPGQWCSPPNEHFDLAKPAFSLLADYTGGIVPVQYRRVPCQKQGGIKFTIGGNPYYYEVRIWNVGGSGEVKRVLVKGSKKVKWTMMKRLWGQLWVTEAKLVGESLTFRVQASDNRFSTSWHVAPPNWQFGQTFEGKNFR